MRKALLLAAPIVGLLSIGVLATRAVHSIVTAQHRLAERAAHGDAVTALTNIQDERSK